MEESTPDTLLDKIGRWADAAHAQVEFEELLGKYPRKVIEAARELKEVQSLIAGYMESSWEGNIEAGQELPRLLARADLTDADMHRLDNGMYISGYRVKYSPEFEEDDTEEDREDARFYHEMVIIPLLARHEIDEEQAELLQSCIDEISDHFWGAFNGKQ